MDEEFKSEPKSRMKERLYQLREMIDDHVEQIHTSITESAKQTIKFIQMMQKTSVKMRQRPISSEIVKLDPSMFIVRRLWDQVAEEDESSSSSSSSENANANDFDVALNYQPKNSRSKKSKEQQQQQQQQTTEPTELSKPTEQKKRRKKRPRITKGEEVAEEEEEEITARISRGDDQQIEARISSFGEESNENSQSSPSMVKLIMVNTKVDRFKRKTKNINGKMVNRRLQTLLLRF